MQRVLGILLLIIGIISGLYFGVWTIVLDLRVLNGFGGFWAAALGFVVLPVMLLFAPFYAAAVHSYWTPLWISLLCLVSYPVIGLGAYLIGESE